MTAGRYRIKKVLIIHYYTIRALTLQTCYRAIGCGVRGSVRLHLGWTHIYHFQFPRVSHSRVWMFLYSVIFIVNHYLGKTDVTIDAVFYSIVPLCRSSLASSFLICVDVASILPLHSCFARLWYISSLLFLLLCTLDALLCICDNLTACKDARVYLPPPP